MTTKKEKKTRLYCDRFGVGCGYVTKTTTLESAEYHLRRHSCATHVMRAERSFRRQEQLKSSGEKRECFHKVARHQHGERTAYVLDKCRCRECRDAANAYYHATVRRDAYGQGPFVDPEPVRAHLASLSAAGLGWKQVARLTGVSNATIGKLVLGVRRPDGTHRPPSSKVRKETAEKILSVHATIDTLAGGASVPQTGTRRRLEALVYQGWSVSRLSREYGNQYALHQILGRGSDVTVDTARRVRDLYERLWDVAPPEDDWHSRQAASRARNLARSRGYLPPLAWDDETIDDPDTQPDLAVLPVPRGRNVRGIGDDMLEDYEFLREQGLDDEQIAARFGVTVNYLSVLKKRKRA